jgi:transcriptional regulator with XRE-family HTH domain
VKGEREPRLEEAVEIGERLRRSREYLGLSQEEVADYMEISRPAISNVEAGKRKVSSEELRRFSRLYRRPYEYFLGETEEIVDDETVGALFRTTQELSDGDREQVLRFAQFLKNAGKAPAPGDSEE